VQGWTRRHAPRTCASTASGTYNHLILCEQVHGSDGIVITRDDNPYHYQPYHHYGDYIVTTHTGIACGIATADCAPIIIYDAYTPAIAAVHAGWRGLYSGIIYNALSDLAHITDRSAHDMQAYIVPAHAHAVTR